MLLRAIEDETFREEMQDKSGGNGRVLLQLLADHGKTAKPRDITLVTTKYNTVASAGVSGPLTRESFNEWIKLLLKARRAVPPKSRSSDEQICEIIDQFFFGDQAGDLGNLYELHLSQHSQAETSLSISRWRATSSAGESAPTRFSRRSLR